MWCFTQNHSRRRSKCLRSLCCLLFYWQRPVNWFPVSMPATGSRSGKQPEVKRSNVNHRTNLPKGQNETGEMQNAGTVIMYLPHNRFRRWFLRKGFMCHTALHREQKRVNSKGGGWRWRLVWNDRWLQQGQDLPIGRAILFTGTLMCLHLKVHLRYQPSALYKSMRNSRSRDITSIGLQRTCQSTAEVKYFNQSF